MGQIDGQVRVWGATAVELLAACVAGAGAVSIDGYLALGPGRRGLIVHYLQTRSDGVVVLEADGGTPSFSAPPSWVILQSTSCCKGIDYEIVTIRRGDERLLSIYEDPSGNLEVTRGDTTVESIPQEWTAAGEPIPRANPTTFRELVDKWLPVIAVELGEAAAVLEPGRDPAPPAPESSAQDSADQGFADQGFADQDGDDIPF